MRAVCSMVKPYTPGKPDLAQSHAGRNVRLLTFEDDGIGLEVEEDQAISKRDVDGR